MTATFALFAYNQEPYIREAVESALAQTGESLEIIISDDCSTDQTFEIIRETAAAYSGPHRVLLNRNDLNLGLGGHVNLVTSMATGELIIFAAGDDISTRDRSQKIIDLWRTNPNIGAIHSAFYRINNAGHLVGGDSERVEVPSDILGFARRGSFIPGATSSFSRSVFDKFHPLIPSLVHEDKALPFRALLLDMEIGYIDEPLVSYRSDVGISADYSARPTMPERVKMLQRLVLDCDQRLADLDDRPPPEALRLMKIITRQMATYLAELTMLTAPTPVGIMWTMISAGPWLTVRGLAKRVRFAFGC